MAKEGNGPFVKIAVTFCGIILSRILEEHGSKGQLQNISRKYGTICLRNHGMKFP